MLHVYEHIFGTPGPTLDQFFCEVATKYLERVHAEEPYFSLPGGDHTPRQPIYLAGQALCTDLPLEHGLYLAVSLGEALAPSKDNKDRLKHYKRDMDIAMHKLQTEPILKRRSQDALQAFAASKKSPSQSASIEQYVAHYMSPTTFPLTPSEVNALFQELWTCSDNSNLWRLK